MKMACALLLGNLSHERKPYSSFFHHIILTPHVAKNQKTIVEKGVPLLLENLKEATATDLKAALYSSLADISLIKGVMRLGRRTEDGRDIILIFIKI